MKKKLVFLITLLLSLVFLWTAVIKLWGYVQAKTGFDFFPFVEDYQLVAFWILMVSQSGIAIFLWPRRTRLLAFYAAFFVLIILSTYLYVMLHYATHIPCLCTGVIPGLSWQGHFWFTLGFTVLAGAGVVLLPKDIHARG